jgi:tRNA threonylcarbamoyladenosine biosynthesis protein TsaE
MPSVITNSPEETGALGERWGREAQQGWVFALTGELGAGKTQLVKGLARGLGIPARVHSPTFTLVNEYTGGRLPLFHLDLYRIESPEQFVAAGLEEFLRPEGVTVIEWAEKLGNFGAQNDESRARNAEGRGPSGLCGMATAARAVWRTVRIEVLGPTQRRIRYEDIGV